MVSLLCGQFSRLHGPWPMPPPLPPSLSFLEPSRSACYCRLLVCVLHLWEQTGHRLAQLWLLHHGLGPWPPPPHCAAGQMVRVGGREGPGRAGWIWSRVLSSTLILVAHLTVLLALGPASCVLSLTLLGLIVGCGTSRPGSSCLSQSTSFMSGSRPGPVSPTPPPSAPVMEHCES